MPAVTSCFVLGGAVVVVLMGFFVVLQAHGLRPWVEPRMGAVARFANRRTANEYDPRAKPVGLCGNGTLLGDALREDGGTEGTGVDAVR